MEGVGEGGKQKSEEAGEGSRRARKKEKKEGGERRGWLRERGGVVVAWGRWELVVLLANIKASGS